MLVAAFGAPCIFTNAGFRIVRTILDTVAPGCEHIFANSVEELEVAWDGSRERSIGFTCNSPDERMASLFLESGARLLLFWSDGGEIVADHLRFGTEFSNSVRFASKYLATLEPVRQAPTTTTFLWSDTATDLRDFVASVADAVGLSANPSQLADIMERLVPDHAPSRPVPFESVTGPRSLLETMVSEKAPHAMALIPSIDRIFGCEKPGGIPWSVPLVWPPMLLSRHGAGKEGGSSLVMDVAGPARLLANGPFIHVPPGQWVAAVDVRISENETNNAFSFDVDCGESTGGGSARFPPSGTFTCEIPFSVKTTSLSVSLRLVLEEGAIDGSIELLNVVVSPIQEGANNR